MILDEIITAARETGELFLTSGDIGRYVTEDNLSSWISELPYLKKIRFENLRVPKFPKNSQTLKYLETIEIINIDFVGTFHDIGSICILENLKELALIGQTIGRIPSEIASLKDLRKLTINNIIWETYTNEITHTQKGTSLAHLPREIYKLRKLEFLDLSGINLEDINPEIGNLTN